MVTTYGFKKIINQIEARGSKPSVARTQLFAAYLGVTTSQLLGAEEIKKERPTPNAGSEPSDEELIRLWKRLSPEYVQRVKDFALGLTFRKGPSKILHFFNNTLSAHDVPLFLCSN